MIAAGISNDPINSSSRAAVAEEASWSAIPLPSLRVCLGRVVEEKCLPRD